VLKSDLLKLPNIRIYWETNTFVTDGKLHGQVIEHLGEVDHGYWDPTLEAALARLAGMMDRIMARDAMDMKQAEKAKETLQSFGWKLKGFLALRSEEADHFHEIDRGALLNMSERKPLRRLAPEIITIPDEIAGEVPLAEGTKLYAMDAMYIQEGISVREFEIVVVKVDIDPDGLTGDLKVGYTLQSADNQYIDIAAPLADGAETGIYGRTIYLTRESVEAARTAMIEEFLEKSKAA
jgi:hypothetical protein